MRLLSALGLCLCGAATAAAQARRVELSDFQRFVTVSDPQIAPDGRSIVCVVSRVNWKDNRRDSDLLLVDVASGAQHSLTHDRRGVGSPRWSPTGDRLAFLATAGAGDKATRQVFILDMRGGDALQLTTAAQGVEQFAWKPDGTALGYVTADEPAKRDSTARYQDGFEVGNDGFLTSAAPLPFHLWLIPAAAKGDSARRLTSGGWSLAGATAAFGDEADEFVVLGLVSRLADKSLLQVERQPGGELVGFRSRKRFGRSSR